MLSFVWNSESIYCEGRKRRRGRCAAPAGKYSSVLRSQPQPPIESHCRKSSHHRACSSDAFQKYVGYSPEELLRYLRFKQVVAHLMAERGKPVDWFDLIVQFGYHDQSHLIGDFKFYTGGYAYPVSGDE